MTMNFNEISDPIMNFGATRGCGRRFTDLRSIRSGMPSKSDQLEGAANFVPT
jgi:hypothetical protein